MLERTDKERLATLEADIPWIKGGVARIEISQKEERKDLEEHLEKQLGY